MIKLRNIGRLFRGDQHGLATATAIYHHEPLTQEMVTRLNAQLTMAELANDLAEIGYPTLSI